MKLIFESWIWLIYFDFLMRFYSFEAVHTAVVGQQVFPSHRQQTSEGEICHAIDLACVFYFKKILCLQRSAATTVLLRRHGWNAQMVLGAQLMPFQSHAWVEIENRVVNDKPYVTEMFQVLERC
jgi:hypothetical protein